MTSAPRPTRLAGVAPLVLAGPVVAAGRPSGPALHLLLAFGIVLLVVAVGGTMRGAWRGRSDEEGDDLPDLPEPPEQTGNVLAAPLRGRYLGTVDAGHWREWINARGLSGKDSDYIAVNDLGVRVDRDGQPFWIPREAVRGARLERGHAGKVAAPSRLIVVAWSLDGRELETGFRGEDRARQPKVVRSVHDLIGPMPTAPLPGDITSPHALPRARARLRQRVPAGPGRALAGQDPVPPGGPATMPIPVGTRQARGRRRDPRPATGPRGLNGPAAQPGAPGVAPGGYDPGAHTTAIRRPGTDSPGAPNAADTGILSFGRGAGDTVPTGPNSPPAHDREAPARGTGSFVTSPRPESAYDTGAHRTGSFVTSPRPESAYDTGAHRTGSFVTSPRPESAYDTGAHRTGSFVTSPRPESAYDTGAQATGSYGTGGHPAGRYEPGAHNTGGYPTGAYPTGAHNTAASDAGDHDSEGYETGAYDTGHFVTGAYDMRPDGSGYPSEADQRRGGEAPGRPGGPEHGRFAASPGERAPRWEERR